METYDTNLQTDHNSSEEERLERELRAANKKAKTYFDAMKRSCDEANRYKEALEKIGRYSNEGDETFHRSLESVKDIANEALRS